jgi:hypothetical protein
MFKTTNKKENIIKTKDKKENLSLLNDNYKDFKKLELNDIGFTNALVEKEEKKVYSPKKTKVKVVESKDRIKQ